MTDEELFDRLISQYGLGRRLETTSLAPIPKSLCNRAITNARNFIKLTHHQLTNLPPIYFDLIDNANVNAVAFQGHGKFFIGINSGSLFALQLLFCRMLAAPQVLPNVGNASAETTDVPFLTTLAPDAVGNISAQTAWDAEKISAIPKDRARGICAIFLFDTACDFLIGHALQLHPPSPDASDAACAQGESDRSSVDDGRVGGVDRRKSKEPAK